jgi:hypothetical protein
VRESRELRDLHWHNLTVSASDERHLLDLLWEEFVFADDRRGQARSLEELLALDDLNGMVVWMEGFGTSCEAKLPAFLERFSQALNSISVYRRLQLCCVVPLSISQAFRASVCCAVIDSTPHAGRIDALTYASTLFGERAFTSLEVQVGASVLANLSLWDGELATELSKEPFETILSPAEWLTKWADARTWTAQLTAEQLRNSGLLTNFDGQPRVHSAVAAVRGETGEIDFRVWRGQASILLPFIEDRRRDLLEYLSDLIVLPLRTRYGDIDDVNDLEIGHLYSMFGRDYRVDTSVQLLIRLLREMRNRLAHFSPINCSMLSCREIRNYQSILDFSKKPRG